MRLTRRCMTNRWIIFKTSRKVTFVGCCLSFLVLTLALPGIAQQAMAHKTAATAAKTKSMNVDGVLAMVQAGLSDDVIIARLRKEDKALALEPDEMIRLKQAKVSDAVLKVMLDPEADLNTSVPAAMPTLQPAVFPGIATTRPSGATPGYGVVSGDLNDPMTPHDSEFISIPKIAKVNRKWSYSNELLIKGRRVAVCSPRRLLMES